MLNGYGSLGFTDYEPVMMNPDLTDVRTGVALVAPYGGTSEQVPPPGKTPVKRGTTNGNDRGSSYTRRRRREWLVDTYRANRDVVTMQLHHGPLIVDVDPGTEGAQPACRCYRCGLLLTVDTVTVDRIVPGCRGGTYRRDNIRPACSSCNSVTGGSVRGRS